jgi:NAD(P)H-flavin reductase
MALKKFNLVLQSTRIATPRVRELTFVREDGESVDYLPGQFITLHLPHEEMVLRRSYSLATPPDHNDSLSIAVTHVDSGRATGRLFAMEPGEQVVRGTLGTIAGQVRESGIKRAAMIFVGRVLAAENFPDSFLYSSGRDRSKQPASL